MRITNGFNLGWEWGFGSMGQSRNFAVLASWHPSWSLTWAWALYWSKGFEWKPGFRRCRGAIGWLSIPLLWLGTLDLRWQPTVRRLA